PGADAVDGLPHPRQGQGAEGRGGGDRCSDRVPPHRSHRRGDAGTGTGEGPQRLLHRPRAVQQLRPDGPPRRPRPVRRRRCGGEPDRAASAGGHSRAHPEDRAGMAATHQPDRRRPQGGQGRREVVDRTPLNPALCLSPLALAAPETPPVPGPALPFELPAITQYKLGNGLKVTLVPYGEVPKTNIALVVRLGNVDEAAGQTGLADLAGKLLLQGTRTHNAQ